MEQHQEEACREVAASPSVLQLGRKTRALPEGKDMKRGTYVLGLCGKEAVFLKEEHREASKNPSRGHKSVHRTQSQEGFPGLSAMLQSFLQDDPHDFACPPL